MLPLEGVEPTLTAKGKKELEEMMLNNEQGRMSNASANAFALFKPLNPLKGTLT